MSHHHEHDHQNDHEHHHGHDHCHGHSHRQSPLSFSEKLATILDHWIQHNGHHAEDYRQWAKNARDNGQAAAAQMLESAAELTETISGRLREAAATVQPD